MTYSMLSRINVLTAYARKTDIKGKPNHSSLVPVFVLGLHPSAEEKHGIAGSNIKRP